MNTNSKAKRVLIYGDSITWGRIANTTNRYDSETRYTGVIQKTLGSSFDIIEEGLRGRMAFGENPYQADKDGWKQFTPIYLSHLPINLLIVFLGTNDTNDKANKNAVMISKDIEPYIAKAKELSRINEMPEPRVLLVNPPVVNDSTLKPNTMFSGASSRMVNLASYLEDIARSNNCFFFDTNKHVSACIEDGVHLDKDANSKLGFELGLIIKQIF